MVKMLYLMLRCENGSNCSKTGTPTFMMSRAPAPSVIFKELVDAVNELVRKDHRIQVREVHDRLLAICLGTIHEII